MANLKFKKFNEFVPSPVFSTEQSACFDISFCAEGLFNYSGFDSTNRPFTRSLSTGVIIINPGDRVMVPTRLWLDIPEGHSVRIHPRSGLSLKHGAILVNCEGVIDSDYVDEVFLLMTNVSQVQFKINNGDRIAQGELVKVEKATLSEMKEMPKAKTSRNGGMGSTGV